VLADRRQGLRALTLCEIIMQGSQAFAADPRNDAILIYLNGELVPRAAAKVSVFDGGFVVGDGVWEGLRLHRGKLLFLPKHLERLYWGAREIALDIGLDQAALTDEIWRTLHANNMEDGVHLRVMVTRGLKSAPNQDPRNALGRATIVIVAEFKEPHENLQKQGIKLFTSTQRCTPAHMFDMRLNSHSRLNLICALLQAIEAGADEALMLDPNDFVSSCNATNFFFVKDGRVKTSRGDYCFHGVTRANVIALCRELDVPIELGDFTLAEVHAADEAFVTGTFGGITPVRELDGRVLPRALPGPVTQRVRTLYQQLKDRDAAKP
jgi:branched-chain amino acid aminotransferase